MKKNELIQLYLVLENIKEQGNIKFRYRIVKNLSEIKSDIESLKTIEDSINKIIKPKEEAKEELIRELGVSNGNEIYIDENNEENVKEFNSRIEKINKKYEKEINEYNTKMEEYQKMNQEENVDTEYQFVKISIDDCPEELHTSYLEMLMKVGIIE